MSRIISFAKQRMLFTFVIFAIGFSFTTAILWGHIEGVIGKAGYQTLAKAGLILLPAIALIMTIWELFIDKVGPGRVHKLHPTVKRLIDWCFFGSLILLVAELIHAGALLKYQSSTAEQNNKIAVVGDAQAKIAGASTSAAIESAGKTAQELNASGQRKTAAKIVNTGKETAAAASAKAGEEVSKIAKDSKPDTFLPAWYIDGGMYAALPLLAALFFGITMGLARQAAPYVDADDDGIPDAEEQSKIEPVHYMTREEWEALSRAYSQQPEQQMNDDERERWKEIAQRRREYGEQLAAKFAQQDAARPPSTVGPRRRIYTNGRDDDVAEKRMPARRADLTTTPENAKTLESSTFEYTDSATKKTLESSKIEAGLKALREALKIFSFYTPGQSFKAYTRGDEVWIRAMKAVHGTQETVSSAKANLSILDDALQMPADEFRERLEKFLLRAGFNLNCEEGRGHAYGS